MITKKIAEIFDIKNGYTPSKAKSEYWTNGIIPWFRMDDLRENGFILSKSKKLITKEAIKGKLFEANSIILATTATIGVHALITSNFLCNQQFTNFCLKEEYKKKFNIKFLYYYFFKIDEWCIRNTVSSTFPSVQINKLKLLQIPIPPIEVQNKIVEILDKFTNYKAELKAELTFRKEQYKYYRNKLFNSISNNNDYKHLWEITKWNKSFNTVNKFKQKEKINIKSVSAKELKNLITENGNIRLISTGKFEGFTNLQIAKDKINRGEVMLLPEGGSANLKYHNGEFVNALNLVCSSIDSNIYSLKYIYYFLTSNIEYIESCYKGSCVKHPDMREILDIKIPIPPIEVQNKIVEILDKFSSLINNISEGLPKEIELRNKQYEYYRDLLLDFEDK